MTTFYSATVLLNGNPEAMHRGYEAGDQLAFDARTVLALECVSVGEALDRAFEVGNRMAQDQTARSWSPDVRSVSVGDVIYVTRVTSNSAGVRTSFGGAFAVARVGFTKLAAIPMAGYGPHVLVALGVAREVAA